MQCPTSSTEAESSRCLRTWEQAGVSSQAQTYRTSPIPFPPFLACLSTLNRSMTQKDHTSRSALQCAVAHWMSVHPRWSLCKIFSPSAPCPDQLPYSPPLCEWELVPLKALGAVDAVKQPSSADGLIGTPVTQNGLRGGEHHGYCDLSPWIDRFPALFRTCSSSPALRRDACQRQQLLCAAAAGCNLLHASSTCVTALLLLPGALRGCCCSGSRAARGRHDAIRRRRLQASPAVATCTCLQQQSWQCRMFSVPDTIVVCSGA